MNKTFAVVLIVLLAVVALSSARAADPTPYQNRSLPLEQRVDDLLSRMSLAEKIDLLSGVGFDTKVNQRLGIPAIRMTDGPAGVRWGRATAFPAPIALAASWDPVLVHSVYQAMAKETKQAGRNYLLAPCVNIHRFPLGGRNFESYGEDPFLAGRMAVAAVTGIQGEGVLASVKHFACNNQEWQRSKVDVTIDERALQEIYLPAFKAAVQEGGVWTVMDSYNKINGHWASENRHLIMDILKGDWKFTGVVVSDWGATHHTVESANAGQDLEMPTAEWWGPKLLQAVKDGLVSPATIDDKVRRILRVMMVSGIFDGKPLPVHEVAELEAHRALTRRAAREGMVLLKNKAGILPLNAATLRSVAVIGPNAAVARCGGGGSSKVTPTYRISPLQGLTDRLGKQVIIHYAFGLPVEGDIRPLAADLVSSPIPSEQAKGWRGEYFANKELSGKPLFTRQDPVISFNWGYDGPDPRLHGADDSTIFSVRWTGRIRPTISGVYRFKAMHTDGVRVFVDTQPVIDRWADSKRTGDTGALSLTADRWYTLRVEYYCNNNISDIKFGWEAPGEDGVAEAVQAAKKADVAIIVTGLSEIFETESRDRDSLSLPSQDRLIGAVAEANPNTIVVVQTGSPITMEPWAERVAAIIQSFYPGQEGGAALAEVLLGESNPSGKLPFSILRWGEDSPAFVGYADPSLIAPYREGIWVGYRYLDKNRLEPRFPFGHGLSYTEFKYDDMTAKLREDGEWEISLVVSNVGNRAGAEVVELYVQDVACSAERPEKELKGFAKVFLNKGETTRVSIRLKRDAFAFYDASAKQWRVEPGMFKILAGSSSRDIRLQQEVNVE